MIKKLKQKINRSETYIREHSTKRGQPQAQRTSMEKNDSSA